MFPGHPLQTRGEKIETWRCDYNQVRPHSALGYLTPEEFAKSWAATGCQMVVTTDVLESPNPEKVSLSLD